jgi:hypothetical protein
MVSRLRTVLLAAAMVAAFGPLAAVQAAPMPQPDDATSAAIVKWRTTAVTLVSPVYQDIVTATYADRPVADTASFNDAMIARAQAEQTAFTQLDSASVTLIENYYAAVQTAVAAAAAPTPDLSDV